MLEEFKDEIVTQHYKDGVSYQQSMEFQKKWAEYERFFQGDQWPTVTERTKHLPRCTFNVIAYIQNHKKASVQNENLKMVFTPEEVQEQGIDPILDFAMQGARQFTKYSETVWERLQMDKLNDELLTSSSNIGCGILHFYWDNSLSGGIINPYIGEIAGEFLDPSNVFFGNPQVIDVQKQPYITISSRELLDTVRAEAQKNNVPDIMLELIRDDKDTSNRIYDTEKTEVKGTKKVNVLTEYIKKNNKVYFKRVCNGIIIQQETDTGLRIYPIALMNWKPRKKCIYGTGDTEGLIVNQKAINFCLSMMLISTQNNAFPKVVAKVGALKQDITNQAGEIITDYSINGDGIKYLKSEGFNPMSLNLIDKFVEFTKEFSNANESAMGISPGADTSAAAISLLQKSAGVSLEDIKSRFYRCMEDVGRIWLEFWCTKYNIPRPILVKDNAGNEYTEIMTGTEYKDFPYSIKIDVGQSSSYSEFLQQSSLDKLFDGGHIDLLTYIKYSSDNNIPNKESLMADIKMAQAQMYSMTGQIPQGNPSKTNTPIPEEIKGDNVNTNTLNKMKPAKDINEMLPTLGN